MVRIRLMRTGTTKVAHYRLVAADHRYARNGRHLEVLGTYDPTKNPPVVNFKLDRIDAWLKKGALPSETVGHLIKRFRKAAAAAAATPA